MIIFTILCIGRDYKGQGAKLKCHRIRHIKCATSLHILAPYKRLISHSCTYMPQTYTYYSHLHTCTYIKSHQSSKSSAGLSYLGQFFTTYVSQNFTPKIFLQAVVCTAFYGAPDAILLHRQLAMIWAARVTQHTNLIIIIIITTLPSSTLCDLLSFFRNSLILHVAVYQTHAINNQHVNSISMLDVFSWYELNSVDHFSKSIYLCGGSE